MVPAPLVGQGLPAFRLPKMSMVPVITFVIIYVITFEHGSGMYVVDWKLNDDILQSSYRLRRQYPQMPQVSPEIYDPNQLNEVTPFQMAIFSVLPPRLPSDSYTSSTKPRRHLLKRSRIVDDEFAVCPSVTAWRALETALDINNTAVRIYQPADNTDIRRHAHAPMRQWFYTVTCRNDVMASLRHCPGCCLAIDHVRFSSSCKQKRSYVMAYVTRSTRYEWRWIQVDTSCSCAVSSRQPPRQQSDYENQC